MEQSQATTVESLSQATITSSESQASSSGFHTQESSSAQSPRRTSRRKHKPNPKYYQGMFKFAEVAKSYKSACKGPDQDWWMLRSLIG
jgi:hypothetical protein